MVNGFKLISMAPSPYLGVADSPLMTWGEVESTPYRLEGCDTPLHAISGPGFTIKVLVVFPSLIFLSLLRLLLD